jgi:two-component system CheB/CheR fusion protein
LRSDEVQGKHLLTLDIGLPVDKLKQPIRACLTGDTKVTEVVIDAINRRGRSVKCRASCTRLLGPGGVTAGAVIVIEELKN